MEGQVVGDAVAHPTSHTALLYDGEQEFLDAAVPFLEEGFDAGIPALVMLPASRFELVHERLAASAGPLLTMVRAEDAGRNPAWIIPAIIDFAAPHMAVGRAVRGVGEPVYEARTPHEVVECERHESLLDLALAGTGSYDIMCPYDVGALRPEAVDVACRTHGRVHRRGTLAPSEHFIASIPDQLTSPLPDPPGGADRVCFDGNDVWPLRKRVTDAAADAGFDGERLEDLVVAVSEALSNSVEHGGGGGELLWWLDGDRFLCEIRDHGAIPDPLAGRLRPPPVRGNGRGLWLMHQLCDLVQIRHLPDDRKAIRLHLGR